MAGSILLEVTSSTSFWKKKHNKTTQPPPAKKQGVICWESEETKTTQMEPKPPESFNILQVGYRQKPPNVLNLP